MDPEITESMDCLGGTISSSSWVETNLPKREWKEKGMEIQAGYRSPKASFSTLRSAVGGEWHDHLEGWKDGGGMKGRQIGSDPRAMVFTHFGFRIP